MRSTLVLIAAIVVLFTPSYAQQDMPACVAEMMQQSGFMECFQGFMGFIQNMGSAQGGQPPAGGQQGQQMMQIMCSPEGKAAMKCMMPFLQQCPALTQQTQGMDLSAFMGAGGFDAACSVLAGPCSKIMECMNAMDGGAQPEMDGDNSGNAMSAGGASKPSNPFADFFMGVGQACGPMKAQVTCLMKYEKECGDKVRELENQVKQAMEAAVKDENSALAGYDDLKKFMMEECGTVDTMDPNTQKCVMQKMNSQEFNKCYKNATEGYKVQGDNTCGMYEMQSKCLEANVAECGKDSVALIQRNMNLVVKNVPKSCTLTQDNSDDPSAATNVKLATTTLLMVAVSAFVLF